MTSPRMARSASPNAMAKSGDVHQEASCRLAFVLAEGLRHIADRRAREIRRRGTMRRIRPARQTDPMKQPPRTRTRSRTRRQRDSIAP